MNRLIPPFFRLLCLMILGLTSALPAWVEADLTCWTESALTKVMPEDAPTDRQSIRLQACRNEVEWGQIVLRSTERVTVRFHASDLVSASGRIISAGQIAFHSAVYVHVSHPSGNRVRTPADWPEVLPQANQVALQPNRNQPVYVRVQVPETAAPGLYETSIEVMPLPASSHPAVLPSYRLPLSLRVWPLTIPTTPTTRTSYYVWWDGIEQRFGLKDKPEERRRVFDRFFSFMLDHRLCPMSLPVDIKQADRYMRDPRVNGVRLPYRDDDALLQDTISFVKSKGWLDRCYYYLFDEPPRRMWPEARRAGFQIAGLDPLMPRLDTIQPEPELEGAISIWCPNVESVYLYDDRIAEISKQSPSRPLPLSPSPSVWWYTCVFPKYPYPTFLLDDDAIAPRLLFWSQPRHGLTGSLYINTIHWGPEGNDPWAEAAVDPVLLNNNDGLLMYTGRGRTLAEAYPVTGLRLEMIRDGLEDVELCNMLRDEIARRAGLAVARQHLAALASQIVPDLRHAERDPAKLLRLRERVVDEIMMLQQRPTALEELLKLPLRAVPEPESCVAGDKFAVAQRATPVIDGKLDDPAWEASRAANAPGSRTSITRFRNLTGRIWPSQETLVNCLYDDGNLYFAFRCQEPEIEKLRPYTETQDLAKSDRVAVALSIDGQERWFVVTMEGLLFEAEGPNTGGRIAGIRPWGRMAANGAAIRPLPVRGGRWEARTRCDANGYTVEIRVPRDGGAGYQPAHGPDNIRPLQFNLFRYAAPGEETLYFTGRHSSKRNPFEFGTLELR